MSDAIKQHKIRQLLTYSNLSYNNITLSVIEQFFFHFIRAFMDNSAISLLDQRSAFLFAHNCTK